ncbi:MAG: hypothetical protein WKF66_02165 [Pedobacter sp.]
MKQPLVIIIATFIVLLIITSTAVSIVLRPAFINELDLTQTETANIGTALSGITTPFFTAISSVLIFFALIKQIKSNKDQRLKSDGDMIFLLLSQLEIELDNYSFEANVEGNKETRTGYYALLTLFKNLNFDSISEEAFFKSMHGYKVILLIKSFKMAENRIELSKLGSNYSDVFYYKLFNFYQSKLRNSLNYLIENNVLREKTEIPAVKFIVRFFEESNVKSTKYLGDIDVF